jgi:hypothetical protein
MKWNWALKVGLLLVFITIDSADATECKSIEDCIALIPEIEGKAWGVGKVDDAVRNKLKSFGREALLPLVKLTGEDSPNRRVVADSLIADIKELNEGDFAMIRQAIQNNIEFDGDGGWSLGALGYIGGEEAGRYLVSELRRAQTASNQIGTAFIRLGLKGVPFLIEGLRCFESCHEEGFSGFSQVFSNYQRWIKMTDNESARRLFLVASNKKIKLVARKTAMSVIGYIANDPEIAKQIYHYADKNNEFFGSVLTSLQSMKSPLAAGMLISGLDRENHEPAIFNSNFAVFRDLSELGLAANGVGAEVIDYLTSTSWEDRIHAAVTLGYIGYFQAIPELLKLLSNEYDWQQTYAAIKSLHLLADKSTIPMIEKVANTHWYAPLREYAQKVSVSMRSNKTYEPKHHADNFAFYFLDYQRLKQENHVCDQEDYMQVSEPIEIKQYASVEAELVSFQYKNPVCSNNHYEDYCASSQSTISPSLAAKFGEKWLIGDNRGEWGGELIVFEDGKAVKTLLNENIEDVYVIGEYAYVLTGLAHMSSNNGLIYRLKDTKVGYLIEPLYRLPGAPRTSWKTGHDTILVNTASGAVVFNPKIGFKMAECTNK